MPTTKIRLQQLEDGQILKQLVQWFKISHVEFPERFNSLRVRTRRAVERAGLGPKDVDRLIAEVRSRRAKA
ncbi:MAG: hypothetical protein Q8R91_07410 [Candidatus Omnitrophota bacterium]|nr:hypothetical protein [Candidatus Omnitrophota bacterium]